MHKNILSIFKLLKNSTQFVKIVSVFGMLMLLMYWIENLAGYNWAWLNIFSPLIKPFINIGAAITKESVKLFVATFEFKYFIALILYLAIYFIAHLAFIGLCSLEEIYEEGRKKIKKAQEDMFNATLEQTYTNQQKRIKRFDIYVEPILKQNINTKLSNISLEEEARVMNKFLISKTGVAPKRFGKGFLYSFTPFDDIDETLDIFSKLFTSDVPLDYIICVQSYDTGIEIEALKKLIDLKFINKIAAWSDTVFRYSFNDNCKYETSQLGLFQIGEKTNEAHQFIKKFI